MEKLTIAIADDHAIVRKGVRQLIEEQPDMEVVAESPDGHGLLKKVKTLRPDVVILDISMPKLSGLELIKLVKDGSPNSRVIILSMYKKEAYAHQALKLGAMGYVLKTAPGSELIAAIHSSIQEQFYMSQEINSKIIQNYLKEEETGVRRRSLSKYDLLSDREQQVFRLVVDGNSTRQVAEILCVSPKTAEKHRSNIIKKLGINDTMSMLKYAIKIGIADPEIWWD
ncbi:MAG: response regulator transcription factor [Desulfobulbaceae bacterium]|nr:response regulator transcription factor [Desulfobulbaceae bacterium]